jgi:D-arabinose 1-dehydrogenase-like Zn-dependent alcohol dehydrogenase
VFLGSDDQSQNRLWICSGYLPCGACDSCQAGLHLACESPTRPGWNAPGGLANAVSLPASEHLATIPGAAETDVKEDVDWHWVAAVLAAAGPTFQAAATAGMAPGDTVIVLGAAGPGAIPLRVLAALGLRPVWVTENEAPTPEVSAVVAAPRNLTDLPSARRHLIDLSPRNGSVEALQRLARSSVSCTFVGTEPPSSLPPDLLAGQATVRWVRDLHPHLALDLVALCRSGRLPCDDAAIEPCTLDGFPQAFGSLEAGTASRWPVLLSR